MNDETDHKSGDGVPSGYPSTHSPAIDLNCIKGVDQDEGRRFCITSKTPTDCALYAEFSSPYSWYLLGNAGDAACDKPSEPHPDLHLEHYRAADSACSSKDSRQAECDEGTETKKEKSEIEKRTDTPQTRKTDRQNNNIQPSGELCDLSATHTRERSPSITTYTDKRAVPFREVGAHSHKILAVVDPAYSPDKENAIPSGDSPLHPFAIQLLSCKQAIVVTAQDKRLRKWTPPKTSRNSEQILIQCFYETDRLF